MVKQIIRGKTNEFSTTTFRGKLFIGNSDDQRYICFEDVTQLISNYYCCKKVII